MKFLYQLIAAIWTSLLCGQMAFAVEWDGKSPLWVGGGACVAKIRFSVMDKMSTAERYDVVYRVGREPGDYPYISTKSYSGNPADADAIFPDDFYYARYQKIAGQAEPAPSLCAAEKIYWLIYVNGKKIGDGFIWTIDTSYEVNGKLIRPKRR
jgi:hypothetical protein